jgi:monoterpene epsilon-lactone hydrolase
MQAEERRFRPPRGISDAARDFMIQSGTAAFAPVDLSPEGVAALRRENSEVAAAGCVKVCEDLGVMVEEGTLAGVPVQWVSPRQVLGDTVILYLFGGGFLVGCPTDDLSISARLADALGLRVCAPWYRLAPEHPFPAARDDVMAVYRQLASGSGPVLVVGESAGGNLALGLTLAVAHAKLPPPVSLCLLSPWIDLTHSGDSHVTLAGLDPTLSVPHFLEPASLAYAGALSRASSDISPLFAELTPDFPPTIVTTASRDLLLRWRLFWGKHNLTRSTKKNQTKPSSGHHRFDFSTTFSLRLIDASSFSDSVRLCQRLRAHTNAVVDLRVVDGLWHVYEWYPQLPEAAESIAGVAKFCRRFLPNCP